MEYEIKTKGVPSFWRCGREWSSTVTVVDESEFDAEQWTRLKSEPRLSVSLIEAEKEEAQDLAAMFDRLDPEKDFTKDGYPKVAAVEQLINGSVSAADVKEAWDAFQTETQGTKEED